MRKYEPVNDGDSESVVKWKIGAIVVMVVAALLFGLVSGCRF